MERLIIPISGGSHTGKTTLWKALQGEFTEAYFAPEPATIVITDQIQKENDTGEEGVLPWTNNHDFSNLVIEEAVRQEELVPSNAELVIKDRSLVDTLAYCYADNFPDLAEKSKDRISRIARYAFVLFCEPLQEYELTEVRRETVEVARSVHEHLRAAYEECGVPMVILPAVSVEDRLKIVRQEVAALMASSRKN